MPLNTSAPRRSILYMSVISSSGYIISILFPWGEGTLVGCSGILRKLLSGQQLVGAEGHRQELLESHDRVLAELVVHEDGSAGLLEEQTTSVREMTSN